MAACADPALGGCDAPPVPVDVAEAAVREVLASLLGDPRHLHGYLQAAQRAAVAEGATTRARRDDTDAELRRLEATRARYLRLLDDAEPGSEEEAVALERLVTLKRELAALRAQQAARGSEVVTLPPVVTLEQVSAFLGRFKGQLEGDAVAFQRLVATLGAEHGLIVELLDDRRVRVSLALDAGAVTGGPRLVATPRPACPCPPRGETSASTAWSGRRAGTA